MTEGIKAAMDMMDRRWPGYGMAKAAIRSHVEELESAVLTAHWCIWRDGDVEGALKVLAGTGIVPTRPLMAQKKGKAIKRIKP